MLGHLRDTIKQLTKELIRVCGNAEKNVQASLLAIFPRADLAQVLSVPCAELSIPV